MRRGPATALRRAALRGLAILPCLALAVPAWAQDSSDSTRISSVTLTATVPPGADHVAGDVDVLLEYRLERGAGRTPEPVRIHALGIGNTEIRDVQVEIPGASGESHALTLGEQDGARESATVDLASLADDALVLSYRVSGAVAVRDGTARVRLPLLVLDLPQAATTRSTFQASIEVPAEWRVAGTFPSGLTSTTPGLWSGDLQVVPAFVSISARPDGGWRPGLPWALDVATVLILIGVSLVGWRHLSGVVREARA